EQRDEGWLYFPNEPFMDRRNKHVPPFVRFVKLLVELRVDGAETNLRLLHIDAGIETRDRRPRAVIARFFREIDRARHPNLGFVRLVKPGRHHTNHRDRPWADLDLFPDDGRVGSEAALPQAVADDRGAYRPRFVVVGDERPSDNRLDAEHGEEP